MTGGKIGKIVTGSKLIKQAKSIIINNNNNDQYEQRSQCIETWQGYKYYYCMAASASAQDEANPVF